MALCSWDAPCLATTRQSSSVFEREMIGQHYSMVRCKKDPPPQNLPLTGFTVVVVPTSGIGQAEM